MNDSTIRVRYAKAFFLAAHEKSMIETVKADVEKVLNICNKSIEFILLLESPVITTSKKVDLINDLFKNEINELTLNFLLLIAKNKREVFIPGICTYFLEIIRKDRNIKSAVLTTATEVDEKTVNKIADMMGKELNAKIELSREVDPEIIGGLILRIEDKQFDSSVYTKLKNIKQHLLETELK